jgi:proline iminopeptidase
MMLSFAYAGAHPDHIKAVATMGSGFINPAGLQSWSTTLQSRLTDDQNSRLAALSPDLSPDEAAIAMFKITLPAYLVSKEAAAKYANSLKVGDMNGQIINSAQAMFGHVEEYIENRLDRIKAPVLVVQGKQDLSPAATATTIDKMVPNCTVVMLDRCGHIPWLDQPDATWKAVDAFFDPFSR